MATITKEKINAKTLKTFFGIKSYSQVRRELAISRAQVSQGKYKEAGAVIKGLRTKYDI